MFCQKIVGKLPCIQKYIAYLQTFLPFFPTLFTGFYFNYIFDFRSVEVNFGQRDPWFKPPPGFVFIEQVPFHQRVRGMIPSSKASDCEVSQK